jgi:hypothetical protein
VIVPNPFTGDAYYPVYDDGRGECYLIGWFGDEPCSGSVESRATPNGVIPCCQHHYDLL